MAVPARAASAPRVSVIVSTRNHARWLPQMVDAVMRQDLDDELELIVADDASTDETPQLMQALIAGAPRPITYVRLAQHGGAAAGRNAALARARGAFIAFTDSDCVPSPGWLRAALQAFDSDQIGIVQGKTVPAATRTPLFSHHIETAEIDGHFSTSNIVYRAAALDGHRFDPSITYWEDTDLGWRVLQSGWRAAFTDEAVVAHQVIRIGPIRWLLWPRRLRYFPAKAHRYPAFRRHLFLGLWVRPLHLLFDLALLGVIVSARRRSALLLTLPYLASFWRTRRLEGRFPPLKLAAHVGWDAVGFLSLLAASIRHRALVL